MDPKPSPLQHTLRQCEISGFDIQDDIPLRISAEREEEKQIPDKVNEKENRNNRRNTSRQRSASRVNSLSPEYTHVTCNKGHNNSILEMISEIDSTTLNNDKESPAALRVYQDKRVERLNTEPDPDPEVLSYAPLKNSSKYDQY